MTVDLLDILTPAEALRALSLSDNSTSFTEELEQMVTGISGDIDRIAGPVVYRTVTGERHHGAGTSWVELKKRPVVSVSSLVEWNTGTSQTLTLDTDSVLNNYGFAIDFDTGRVLRRSGGTPTLFADGTDNVIVTYVAGRYATTATVDRRFKRVAASVLRAEWAVASPSYRKTSNFDEDTTAAYATTDDMIRALLRTDLPVLLA